MTPVYAELDEATVGLAKRITEAYRASVGGKKGGELSRVLRSIEEESDYKLVRGLSELLERRCRYEVESQLDPRRARALVFEEASRRGVVVSQEERTAVIGAVAEGLRVTPEAVEGSLYSDLDGELVLKEFNAVQPEALVKQYNLSLAQTLLFRSLRMEFTASGNWKRIFGATKKFGLMYSVEGGEGGGFTVSLDGPLSLLRMTERYGTSLAKVLPEIVRSGRWRVSAEILNRSRGRTYAFEADSVALGGLMEELPYGDEREGGRPIYDSTVEERFARSFAAFSSSSGWALRREPEPLVAGSHVLIPDFSIEKRGVRVYLEIVGFWTQEYLERKVRKLRSLADVDMIVAVDEGLACSKFRELDGMRVFYYRGEVPVKPVVEHLRRREAAVVEREAELLRDVRAGVAPLGEVATLEGMAKQRGASVEAARRALEGAAFEGYRRIGDSYVRETVLSEMGAELEGVRRLPDAVRILESHGVETEQSRVLESLGYEVVWDGIDPERGRLEKKGQA